MANVMPSREALSAEPSSRQRGLGRLRSSVTRAWKAITRIGRPKSSTSPEGQPQPTPPANPQTDALLPPELIDQVIDYLHDDKQTLRSCSLLCRLFVPSARFHLFRTVVIKKDRDHAMSVLASMAPELVLYIRNLTLENDGDTFKGLHKLMEGEKPRARLAALVYDIAPRAKNVENLTLKDIPFDSSIVQLLSSSFPNLHTISLFDCWFRCHADLDKLIRDHPKIHTIRCGRVSSLYGLSPPDSNERVGRPLFLRQLKITEAYSPSPLTLMPWLVPHSNPEHFIYTVYRLSQIIRLNQTIVGLAALKHLHIVFYRWRTPDTAEVEQTPEVLSLTPHHPPAITTLTLDGRTYSLYLVITLLGQLDPHLFVRLHTVNLYVHVKAEDVAKVPDHTWAAMQQTLSVLLSLGRINFYNMCKDTKHIPDGGLAIEKRLPVLHARKLLHFEFQEPPY